MGNYCFPFHIHKTESSKPEKNFRILKPDGKILEYTKPMLVKDILMNFSAGCGIGLSRKPVQVLPQDYKLKIGNFYYLIPSVSEPPSAASLGTMGSSSKRIKVIITKEELQKFLSKEISAEEMCILGVIKKDDTDGGGIGTNSSSRWQPVLETILEGSE